MPATCYVCNADASDGHEEGCVLRRDSKLCPGCYSIVPSPGWSVAVDSGEERSTPVKLLFCSQLCAEATADLERFVRV